MKLSRYLKWLAGFLILVSPASYLKSQTAHQNHPWWVNLGAGPALVSNTFAMNAGMVYCYQFDRSIISARILGVTRSTKWQTMEFFTDRFGKRIAAMSLLASVSDWCAQHTKLQSTLQRTLASVYQLRRNGSGV
jgi:hypothetical protein